MEPAAETAPATDTGRAPAVSLTPPTPDARPWLERNGSGNAADPKYSDPAKFAQVYDASTGEIVLRKREADGSIGERVSKSTTAPANGASEQRAVAADNSGERIRIGDDLQATPDEIRAALARAAAEDSRKASLPAADGYKLELPSDLQLPPGVDVGFDLKDPVKGDSLRRVMAWAHENGLSQSQFSGLLGLYAGSLASEQAVINAARSAENAKLGSAGAARVEAVTKWLHAELGDDIARPMLQTLVTAQQVTGWEKIIQKISSQGTGSFTPQHRDDGPERISDEQWDKMTYTQKRAYTERHDQSRFR